MKSTTFWLIDAASKSFETEAALVEHVQAQRVDTSKFIAVSGDAHRLSPQIALLPMGEPAPKRERTPTDNAARDALDMKVSIFLTARTTPATLEQVAIGMFGEAAKEQKAQATAALQRLKKAGRVHSPGRNQWAAKASEASSAT